MEEKCRGRKSNLQLLQEIGDISGELRTKCVDHRFLSTLLVPLSLMKIISWNIKGLNSKRKQWLLWNKVCTESPNILFLQETKCGGSNVKSILKKVWSHS
jgi:hypothetical protein